MYLSPWVHVWVRTRGNEARYGPNHKWQNISQPEKSPISTEHTPVNSKLKQISPAPAATPTHGDPPHERSGHKSESGQARDSQPWRLWGVESIWSHPSVKLMGDEVMRRDTGALPHICCTLIDLTLEITDKDEKCYRFVSLTTVFHPYCSICRKWVSTKRIVNCAKCATQQSSKSQALFCCLWSCSWLLFLKTSESQRVDWC